MAIGPAAAPHAEALAKCLGDSNVNFRQAAAEALEAIRKRQASVASLTVPIFK